MLCPRMTRATDFMVNERLFIAQIQINRNYIKIYTKTIQAKVATFRFQINLLQAGLWSKNNESNKCPEQTLCWSHSVHESLYVGWTTLPITFKVAAFQQPISGPHSGIQKRRCDNRAVDGRTRRCYVHGHREHRLSGVKVEKELFTPEYGYRTWLH